MCVLCALALKSESSPLTIACLYSSVDTPDTSMLPVCVENPESVAECEMNTDPLVYTRLDVSRFGVVEGLPTHTTVTPSAPGKKYIYIY